MQSVRVTKGARLNYFENLYEFETKTFLSTCFELFLK